MAKKSQETEDEMPDDDTTPLKVGDYVVVKDRPGWNGAVIDILENAATREGQRVKIQWSGGTVSGFYPATNLNKIDPPATTS